MSVRLYEDMYHIINDIIKYRDMVNKILTYQKPKEKGCFDVSFSLKILHITFFVYSCSKTFFLPFFPYSLSPTLFFTYALRLLL